METSEEAGMGNKALSADGGEQQPASAPDAGGEPSPAAADSASSGDQTASTDSASSGPFDTLKDVASDVREGAAHVASTVVNTAGDLLDVAKEAVTDVVEGAHAVASEVVDTVQDVVSDLGGLSAEDLAHEAAKRAQYDGTAKLAAAGGDNPDGHAANG